MMQDKVDRRSAIQLAMLMLGGAAITISGCGGGGSSPAGPSNPTPTPTPAPTPTPTPGAAADKNGAISGNHGHVATITGAVLTAGSAVVGLSIRGSSGHNHNISLSGAQVVQVRDGARVSVESTEGDGHTHQVTFN